MGELTAAAVTWGLLFDGFIVLVLGRVAWVGNGAYLHWRILLAVWAYVWAREALILVDWFAPLGFTPETAAIEATVFVLLTRIPCLAAFLWALRHLELYKERQRNLERLLDVRREI